MAKPKLILYTQTYPEEGMEANFVADEIPHLQNLFDVSFHPFNSLPNLLKDEKGYLRFVLEALLEGPISLGLIKNIHYELSRARRLAAICSYVEDSVIEGENSIHYTYWWDEWNVILSIIKKRHSLDTLLVSRAHGFDLYDERHRYGRIPYRSIQVKQNDVVFSVSEVGQAYLKKRNPQLNVEVARLGTKEYGINPPEANDCLTIVTCARMVEVKRLDRVVDVLKGLGRKVRWIHIGDGPLRIEIEQAAKELEHVNLDWRGEMPREKIMELYASEHIDFFINSSDSEGIPVSIMEAVSFGIPVIATNVGGNKEIVNKDTGVLLEKDYFVSFAHDVLKSKSSFDSNRIIEFWKQNFNADYNYDCFAKELKQLFGR